MRKLISLLLVVLTLLSLLTGCDTAEPEETVSATTAAAETEAPTTEPTTEPTEPKTLFEQEGYVLWDGWMHGQTEVDMNGIPTKLTASNKNTVQTSMIVWHDKNKNQKWDSDEEYKSELVDSTAVIQILEYPSNRFAEPTVSEIADHFYNAYNAEAETKVTREEWIELHADYVIKEVLIDFDVACTSFLQDAAKEWNWRQWFLTYYGPTMIDMNTNTVYDVSNLNEVYSAKINSEYGEASFYRYADISSWWDEGNSRDFHAMMFQYSLVPADCKQLIYEWTSYQEKRTIEEWTEHWNPEEKEERIEKSLPELVAENPKQKHLFFQ